MTAESNATVGALPFSDAEAELLRVIGEVEQLMAQPDEPEVGFTPFGQWRHELWNAVARLRKEDRAALSAPATTRAISDAWEILEAHVDNRRDMGHFGMATQMQEALDVLRSALESAPATTELVPCGCRHPGSLGGDCDGSCAPTPGMVEKAPATTGEGEVDPWESEAVTDAWRDFAAENLENGNDGHAPAAMWTLCRAAFNAALAALPPSSGWEPIETAPRDGTEFLGWRLEWKRPAHITYLANAVMGGNGWWSAERWDCLDSDDQPTHWLPSTALPPPPSSGEK